MTKRIFVPEQEYEVEISGSVNDHALLSAITRVTRAFSRGWVLDDYECPIYLDPGQLPIVNDFGGTEWKNGDGKITKRFRRNYYNRTGISVPDWLLRDIGEILSQYVSVHDGWYRFVINRDFDVWSSRLKGPAQGMNNSCFRPGGGYSSNRKRMEQTRNYYAVRVWKDDDKEVAARCWARHNYNDGSLTLFNGYGYSTSMIANILAPALGAEVGDVNIEYTNVYVNHRRCPVLYKGAKPYYYTSLRPTIKYR